jgi:hypothetical protein
LYYNEFWYEYEYITSGGEIAYSIASSVANINFAIWNQPFENLDLITLYDTDVGPITLASYEYQYFWYFLRPGSLIEFEFNSSAQIDFFITDAYNFYLWNLGELASFELNIDNTSGDSGSLSITTANDYYVVFYNEGVSSVDIDFTVDFTITNVVDFTSVEPEGYYVNNTNSESGTFIVPSSANWYFFIYFDPMNSIEESTTITFDVTYGIDNNTYIADISADGKYIVTANNKNYIFLLNNSITSPKLPIWGFLANNSFDEIAISKDGNYIVATGNGIIYLLNNSKTDPKIELWNYPTGDNINSVAISNDGNYISIAGSDGKLYLFNSNSSIPLWIYMNGDEILSIAMSLDGNYIVAGTYNGEVLFFNKESSIPIWSYFAGGQMNNVAINADATYVVAGGSGGILYLFEQSSSIPVWNYTAKASFGSLEDHHCIAISEDGNYIAAGTQDSMFYYFENSSSIPIWNHMMDADVNVIAMSVNGSYIAVGCNDHSMFLFCNELDTRSKPLLISGYDTIIILGFTFLLTIIIIKKRNINSSSAQHVES